MMKTMNPFRYLMSLMTGIALMTISATAKDRSCRIIFPDRPQAAPKTAYLFDGQKNHDVQLPSMNFSEVIKLPAGELTITLSPEIIDAAKGAPPELPSLKIPAELVDFFIVLSGDPKNDKFPVKLESVDIGDNKLQTGETLWINRTKHQISAKLGDLDMTVAPTQQTVTKAPTSESGQFVAKFTYQANGMGDMLLITEQSWWYDVKCKNLGLVIDSGPKLPKIFLFRDFRDP